MLRNRLLVRSRVEPVAEDQLETSHLCEAERRSPRRGQRLAQFLSVAQPHLESNERQVNRSEAKSPVQRVSKAASGDRCARIVPKRCELSSQGKPCAARGDRGFTHVAGQSQPAEDQRLPSGAELTTAAKASKCKCVPGQAVSMSREERGGSQVCLRLGRPSRSRSQHPFSPAARLQTGARAAADLAVIPLDRFAGHGIVTNSRNMVAVGARPRSSRCPTGIHWPSTIGTSRG
jgi:hypothetical protein